MKAKGTKKGFTLIETVITLAILGIIAVLSVSIFTFGPLSFNMQSNTLSNQYSVRHVLRSISRDARNVDSDEVSFSNGTLIIGENKYKLIGDSVFKNDSKISSGIDEFNVSFEENKVSVTVKSLENKGRSFSLSTDIYLRTVE